MINYQFTNEDVIFVEKAIELKNKGYYIEGKQLTDVYNRVLNKRVNPTNCGSCIRQRISELEGALNHYKANEVISSPKESVSEVEVDSNPQEENKANTEPPVKANRKRK